MMSFIDLKNRKGGEPSRAEEATVLLIAPALPTAYLFMSFDSAFSVIISLVLFIVWGLLFENEDRFDKTLFHKSLRKVPFFSIMFSVSLSLIKVMDSFIFGVFFLICTFISAFILAYKTETLKGNNNKK